MAQIEGAGFVTRRMVLDALTYWKSPTDDVPPARLLVDLREVIGYEAGCQRMAREWLHTAHLFGVRRIAIVASSSVLRTALRVASELTRVDLRIFEREAAARRWLLEDLERYGL